MSTRPGRRLPKATTPSEWDIKWHQKRHAWRMTLRRHLGTVAHYDCPLCNATLTSAPTASLITLPGEEATLFDPKLHLVCPGLGE